MICICWFVFLDYLFLSLNSLTSFSLVKILEPWHTTNTLHRFTNTRYLTVEKELLLQLALYAESMEFLSLTSYYPGFKEFVDLEA